MAKKYNQQWLVIGGAVIIIVLGVLLATNMQGYLGASLFGSDKRGDYAPLVRHEISQLHCYDSGTNFCETRSPQEFEKEFTVGYLSTARNGGDKQPIFSCVDGKKNFYMATLDRKDCPRSASVAQLGFVFTSDSDLEASASLFRCFSPDNQDTLLTDDQAECGILGYQAPELLGYMPSAGYLPQRRLNDLCAVVDQQCAISPNGAIVKTICDVRHDLCKGPQ